MNLKIKSTHGVSIIIRKKKGPRSPVVRKTLKAATILFKAHSHFTFVVHPRPTVAVANLCKIHYFQLKMEDSGRANFVVEVDDLTHRIVTLR